MARQDADSDRLPDAGWRDRLHLQAGRLMVGTVNLLRPRVTLGVRLVAFDPEGRVFLVRQSYLPGFHLPGGGVSPGETCREAALREAREEGGLSCDRPPELFGVYLNLALARRDHVVVYVCRGAGREPGAGGGLEVIEAGFYAPDRLPPEATPATRARIAEVLAGRPASETW